MRRDPAVAFMEAVTDSLGWHRRDYAIDQLGLLVFVL